jgi:aryl-alcohol dehydrogenase-like predicted oxidoreductase
VQVPFCERNGVKLLPYGVVAGGFLSDRYLGVPVSKCVPPGTGRLLRQAFCAPTVCPVPTMAFI